MAAAKSRLTECIAELRSWMLANKLRLNDAKTELFVISSPWHAAAVSTLDLQIGESIIAQSGTIKNLGIIFDKNLTMKKHVSSLCRSVNFHLRNLNRIRKYIDRPTCEHAVRSLILSRLDYGNSLLAGLSSSDLAKLQKLQNRAARLIYQVPKRTSTTPLIRELHWLPVGQRIKFKILLHVYNSVYGSSPMYLTNIINKYNSGR